MSEINFADLDLDRKRRTGFNETVFCQGKVDSHLVEIYRRLYEANGEVFGTRATESQAQLVKKEFPNAQYDSVSRILKIPSDKKNELIGNVAVLTAGSCDIPVAEEASQTAEYFGAKVNRFYDVGVAGLNRLLSKVEEIRKANAVIAIAGMEGALASVVGGLVSVPVIAVPTSVGYGANLEGVATLLSMINSCANGISVVNIDNGYGAAYNAVMINRLAEGIR